MKVTPVYVQQVTSATSAVTRAGSRPIFQSRFRLLGPSTSSKHRDIF